MKKRRSFIFIPFWNFNFFGKILFAIIFLSACGQIEKPSSAPLVKVKKKAAKTEAKKTSPPHPFDTLPGAQKMEFSIEYLTGKFDPAEQPGFVPVEKKYSDGRNHLLRKETYEQFKKMWAAAQADGIDLKIISATRNFFRQKQIWEAKWTGKRKIENGTNAAERYPKPKDRALKILEYSSMPGTSRHHWGTDLDINDLDNYTFEHGKGKEVYEWLTAHAHEYGFCQPYSPKGDERPDGYNEEKWHWSYIPVARQLTDMAERSLRDDMIGGFLGEEAAEEIGVVEKYVLGINQACR